MAGKPARNLSISKFNNYCALTFSAGENCFDLKILNYLIDLNYFPFYIYLSVINVTNKISGK